MILTSQVEVIAILLIPNLLESKTRTSRLQRPFSLKRSDGVCLSSSWQLKTCREYAKLSGHCYLDP